MQSSVELRMILFRDNELRLKAEDMKGKNVICAFYFKENI